MTRGRHTLTEIESQPEAWAETLAQLRHTPGLDDFAPERFDEVLFIGCGSTYYLAVAAATLYQQLNEVPARGLPASELWLRPEAYLSPRRRALLVAVSRSGNTTETVRAVAAFRKHT
ncbi:MAG TPA: SIS domain-containing protein, partial [Trueperaceae bacterium]|nr:SIS domain-containing protein [Trueperaceae bacterium]